MRELVAENELAAEVAAEDRAENTQADAAARDRVLDEHHAAIDRIVEAGDLAAVELKDGLLEIGAGRQEPAGRVHARGGRELGGGILAPDLPLEECARLGSAHGGDWHLAG